MKTRLWLLLGGVLAVAGCDGKQDDTAVAPADRDFVKAATQANLAEVDAGKLGLKRAENTDVKRFAQHMIDDHRQANRDLADLAGKKGIRVPDEPDADQQKETARLSEVTGAAFDRQYMSAMVDDHGKAVALFESHSMLTGDLEVRAFADQSLPMLRRHLTMARDVYAKVGGPLN
jgi:putative membrane protein